MPTTVGIVSSKPEESGKYRVISKVIFVSLYPNFYTWTYGNILPLSM